MEHSIDGVGKNIKKIIAENLAVSIFILNTHTHTHTHTHTQLFAHARELKRHSFYKPDYRTVRVASTAESFTSKFTKFYSLRTQRIENVCFLFCGLCYFFVFLVVEYKTLNKLFTQSL